MEQPYSFQHDHNFKVDGAHSEATKPSQRERKLSNTLRRIVAIGALTVASLTGLGQHTASAEAGYPWDNAQPTGALSDFAINGNDIDPNGFVYRNCTSFVAWKLGTLGVKVPYGGNLGNATTWDNNAPRFGYLVDNSPRVGDAAVWDGSWGHVAYVEAVDSKGTVTPTDDTVTVSEYNYAPAYGGRFGRRSGIRANHYVHFLKSGPVLPPPSNARSLVFELLHGNTNSGKTELKAFDGNNDYQTFIGGWVTPEGLHSSNDYDFVAGDVNDDGVADAIGILHQNTRSGRTEVRIIDGAQRFSQWQGGWVTPDGWHSGDDIDYALADVNHDGRKDLITILHQNSPSGQTEARVLDGASQFTRWLGGWVTPEGWHSGRDVSYVTGDYNRDGYDDLFEILHQNSSTGHTEVKIIDGAAHFQRWLAGFVTPEYWHNGSDVQYAIGSYNGDGAADVYQIQHQWTPSGKTEVKVFARGYNYQQYIGGWVTPEGWHGGDDVSYTIPR